MGDLHVLSDVRTMANVWIGKDSLTRALNDESIILHDNAVLRRNFSRVLMLSPIVDAARQPLRMPAS